MGKNFFIVLGMYRSGTSMLARGFRIYNAELGDRLLKPYDEDSDYQKGYFEDLRLLNLDREMMHELKMDSATLSAVSEKDVEHLINAGYMDRALDFLRLASEWGDNIGLKEPRMTRLMPFWRKVFEKADIKPYCFITFRHPYGVAQSLLAREKVTRESFIGDSGYDYLLWLGYTLAALNYTGGFPRALINYETFLQKPMETFLELGKIFDLPVNEGELAIYCDDFLGKESYYPENLPDIQKMADMPEEAKKLYPLLVASAADNHKCPPNSETGPAWPAATSEKIMARILTSLKKEKDPAKFF